MTEPHPLASIVVATHRRRQRLRKLVSALDSQTYNDPYEIVIVDDGSRDGTMEMLADLARETVHPLISLSREHACGPATARNLGWRIARSEMIVFTDDDCVPTASWLERIVEGLTQHDIVQGRTAPDPTQLHSIGLFSRTLSVPHQTGFYECCNIGYRRSLLDALGGFDESFALPSGEDTDLAWRAIESGATVTFEPDALVHHDVHPSNFREHLRAIGRWRGVVEAVNLHPQLRERFTPGIFWLPHQRPAALASLGILLSGISIAIGRAAAAPFGVLLCLPYLRHRWKWRPITERRRAKLVTLPLLLVSDSTEAFLHVWLMIRNGVNARPHKSKTPPTA